MSTFQTISKLIAGLTHRILIAPDTGGLEGYMQVSDVVSIVAANHDHDSDYFPLNGLPIGSTIIWLSNTIPLGWYRLDGQTVSESSNIGEWALSIGQTSNGDGTVNLPNLVWKHPFGAGGDGCYALRATGGASSAWVFESHLPINVATGEYGLDDSVPITSTPSVNQRKFACKTSVGGGKAHNNMPPYYCVHFIVYGGF